MPTDRADIYRRYQQSHREEINERNRKYREAHPEKVKQWMENATESRERATKKWRDGENGKKYFAAYTQTPEYKQNACAYQRALRSKRIEAGLCIDCGAKPPAIGRRKCVACAALRTEMSKKRQAAKVSIGLCSSCGDRPFLQGNWQSAKYRPCERCYLRALASTHLGDAKKSSILQEIWERQGGLCIYTGERLILGLNASIDHRLPKSRFKESRHDPANIDWILTEVNMMKRDRTPEEFAELIDKIVSHRK